jgi:hypothetical protein
VWCLQESNQGHKDFQSFALPTELRHQLYYISTTLLERTTSFALLVTLARRRRVSVTNPAFRGPTELRHQLQPSDPYQVEKKAFCFLEGKYTVFFKS